MGNGNDQSQSQALEQAKDERGRIKGVFSTKTVSKVGTGTTQRKTVKKNYFMVTEQDDGKVEVQVLNSNYVPSGKRRLVPKEELLQKFSPEPEFYTYTVYPKMRELQKTVARADRHRQQGETFSAEYEYSNALKVDEENIRANFGIGLTYLDRGEQEKANDIFERLIKLEAAFENEHKHLFNDFGISLRKNGMFDQCLEYYQRALELCNDDEHLYLNMARVYWEKGHKDRTVEYVKKALQVNPGFEIGKKFLEFLQKKGLTE